MNAKTKEKYIKIFALYKQEIPAHIIAERLSCSARTVRLAVKWCIDNSLCFTSAEHLKIQLEKVRELKLETRQRLRKIQEGSTETITKHHYGQEVEKVKRQKFNFNAEVSLLRLLKDLIAEENRLLGVYDACELPDDKSPTEVKIKIVQDDNSEEDFNIWASASEG